MSKLDYRQLWYSQISAVVREIVRLDKLGADRTVEDLWVQGTLCQVLSRMCASDRLHPSLQRPPMQMQTLFEDGL